MYKLEKYLVDIEKKTIIKTCRENEWLAIKTQNSIFVAKLQYDEKRTHNEVYFTIITEYADVPDFILQELELEMGFVSTVKIGVR